MAGKFILFVLCMLFLMPSYGQVSGEVYEDMNRNGIKDGKEKGVAGVVVSDGLNVVRTDRDGKYQLPGREQVRFVAVSTPSGFRNVDLHYLPFDGSAKRYDFGIYKSPENQKKGFDFIQIADTETYLYEGWLDDLKEYVKLNPTTFIIHTGDLCYEKGLKFHAGEVQSRNMGVPVYNCIGNHDLIKGKYGEEMYEALFGPVWYSFDAGNIHFIVLPMLSGDYTPSYKITDILKWLENDLAVLPAGKPVVVFDHDLLFYNNSFRIETRNGEHLDLLKYNLKYWIYGHWHNHFYRRFDETGVTTYCSSPPDKGGIDHSPSCFRVFHVDAAGDMHSETRYTFVKDQLVVVTPTDRECVDIPDGILKIRVNTYRTVSMAESVSATIEKENKKVKDIDLRRDTDWGWSKEIELAPGDYRLVAKAAFKDGTVLTECIMFTVTAIGYKSVLGANWTNLRGDAGHTAFVDQKVEFPLKWRWTNNATANIYMSSPIVAEGKVIIGTIDDDKAEKCAVVAYDALTGREAWRFPCRNSIKNTIVSSDGLAIACDAEGYLYGIKMSDGTLAWKTKLSVEILPNCIVGLAVKDGVVYGGQSKGLSAVRAKDGKILWENRRWSGGEGTTSTMTVGDSVLVASSHWKGLFGHAIGNGKLLWEKSKEGLNFRDGSATFYDGNFYLASIKHLFVLRPETGEILKQQAVNYQMNSASAPLVTEKYIIVGTSDKGVVAYDRETLKEVWNFRTFPALFYTVPYTKREVCSVEVSPVLVGETVFFGANDGYLYGVDINTGLYRWKRNLGAPVFSSIAVSGNMLYVADFSGDIHAFLINNANQ